MNTNIIRIHIGVNEILFYSIIYLSLSLKYQKIHGSLLMTITNMFVQSDQQ